MKKTLIALVALTSAAFAQSEVTLNLTDGEHAQGWTSGSFSYGSGVSVSDNALVNDNNWGRYNGTYDFGQGITLNENVSLTLSFTMSQTNSDVVNTFALAGTDTILAVGTGSYGNSAQYLSALVSTSDASSKKGVLFNASPAWGGESVNIGSADSQSLEAISTNGTADAFTTTIAWDDELGHLVATVTQGSTSQSYNLGETFTLKRAIATQDGWYNEKIGNVVMTVTDKTPEPATATLSLLALAGLASRRRRH